MTNNERTFRFDLPFHTKCGWPARLVGVLQRTAFPYVVAVWNPAFNAEEVHCYAADGRQPTNFRNHNDKAGAGALDGALSLVNEDDDTYYGLKSDQLRHAHIAPMKSIPAGENIFNHDLSSMGTPLCDNWIVMHAGASERFPLRGFYLNNMRTGQNIKVALTPMHQIEIDARKKGGTL